MFLFNLFLLSILGGTCALKVLTFDMFGVGSENLTDHVRKTADMIRSENPDIVALQGSNYWKDVDPLVNILNFLGKKWTGIKHCTNGVTGVYTKHKILGLYEHVSHGMNVRIQLDSGLEVSVWSMYLEIKEWRRNAVKENVVETLLKYEMETTNYHGRVHNIVELLKHPEFAKQINNSDNVPVIVAGAFNTPSHLDWTEGTKDMHKGQVIAWPVTKLLSEAALMTDSYREVHPDPVAYAGVTSDIHVSSEGHNLDRNAYIFYRGSMRAKSSKVSNSTIGPLKFWLGWTIEQFPLVTEFELTPHKYENKPSFFIGREYLNGTFTALEKCPFIDNGDGTFTISGGNLKDDDKQFLEKKIAEARAKATTEKPSKFTEETTTNTPGVFDEEGLGRIEIINNGDGTITIRGRNIKPEMKPLLEKKIAEARARSKATTEEDNETTEPLKPS